MLLNSYSEPRALIGGNNNNRNPNITAYKVEVHNVSTQTAYNILHLPSTVTHLFILPYYFHMSVPWTSP